MLKPIRIKKECIDRVDHFDSFLLRKKVGDAGEDLHRLLREFVPSGQSIENFSGAIFTFLNRSLIQPKKKAQIRYFL